MGLALVGLPVAFAVRGMGVVPAGKPLAGSGHHGHHGHRGHHHPLIDTPLLRHVAEKIAFSQTHQHHGKGQTLTPTQVDLPPSPHTLRLLFADHEHRPHVGYSPEIRIQVAAQRSGHFILQWLQNGKLLQTLDLRNGATQRTLSLPNGNHRLKLRLVDRASGRDLLPACEHALPVTSQQRM